MKTVSIATARSKFTQLVREVETGKEIVITRDGHPVARITSEEEALHRERRMAVMSLLEMREEWLAAGITGEEIIDAMQEGRDSRP